MRKIWLALAVLGAGCTSQLTGNEGNFVFSYAADDDLLDFNKPIAVGARLDLSVASVGTHLPIQLTAAETDDPAVLSVVDFSGPRLTVQGEGEGNVLLSVEGTTASGETLPDSVNLNVKIPEVLDLWHTCAPGQDRAAYLVDQRVWVPFELRMANSQPVIGYGYYPVDVNGSSAAHSAADSNQSWLALDTLAPGPLTLASQIDDTTLQLDVVAPAQIDGVREPVAFVLEDIDVGDTNAFYVLPEVGGLTVCQADVEKTVVSDTPEICTITERQTPPDGGTAYEYGWFDVTGVSAGTCRYTVTYPSGNGGAGASASFTFEIQP